MYDLSRLGSPIKSDPSVSGGKILTLRMGKAKAGPVVSDNGNFIVDAPFPKEMMKDPKGVSFSCSISSYQSFSKNAVIDATPCAMTAVDQDQADDGCRRGRPVLRVGQGGLFRERGWERDCEVGGWQGGADRGRGIEIQGIGLGYGEDRMGYAHVGRG
jgi:hypothetical protein